MIKKWNLFNKRWFLNANPSLWFVLVYMGVMSLVILVFWDRFNFKGVSLFTFIWTYLALLIVHTFLNSKRYLLLWHYNKSEIFKSYLHASYQYAPYLLIAVVYEHIFLYRDAFSQEFQLMDFTFMHWDAVLFGVQPTIWLEKLLHPVAVEYFMFAYVLFIVYPYFYLVYLYQKNKLPVFHKAMLAQVLSLFIALTCFITLPAKGPRVTIGINNSEQQINSDTPSYTQALKGVEFDFLEDWTGKPSFFQLQYDMWNQIERIKTDCMPSMHTCLCLIVLFYAVKYRRYFKYRKTAMWFWLVGNISLIVSTVYLRYHWVVDVIFGIILAIIAYYLTELFYKYWLKKRSDNKLFEPQVEWLKRVETLRASNH
ncbi:MAG: phosphatase PAP2 family protein [Calditrichaceae bacterium]